MQILLLILPLSTAFVSNGVLSNHQHYYRSQLDSLRKAGDSFISISQVFSPSNRNDKDAFQSAGEALLEAHNAWTQEWDDVTVALRNASEFVYKISASRRHSPVHTNVGELEFELYERIAGELQDASNISGCMSIGPPASVPNFEAVKSCLLELAQLEQDGMSDNENVASHSSRLLTEAAEGFAGLIRDID